MPRQQLIQHHAQRIHIARGVDRFAPHLFRAGILRSHPPYQCLGSRPVHRRGFTVHQLGDAKIQQLHFAFRRYQNIGRLQIAMHHQMLMRILYAGADGAEQLQALRYVQFVPVAPCVDRFSIDIVHYKVRQPLFGAAGID